MITLLDMREYKLGPSVVCMGKFDGVHLGHQKLLRCATLLAHEWNAVSVALTFDRHPLDLLDPKRAPAPLMDENEKHARIRKLGINTLIITPFTQEFSQLTANQYLDEIVNKLAPVAIVCGSDYRFGAKAQGDAHLIEKRASELGYRAVVVEPETLSGDVISSTAIRALLQTGETERAMQMLGEP